jgi:hypothetical protein
MPEHEEEEGGYCNYDRGDWLSDTVSKRVCFPHILHFILDDAQYLVYRQRGFETYDWTSRALFSSQSQRDHDGHFSRR